MVRWLFQASLLALVASAAPASAAQAHVLPRASVASIAQQADSPWPRAGAAARARQGAAPAGTGRFPLPALPKDRFGSVAHVDDVAALPDGSVVIADLNDGIWRLVWGTSRWRLLPGVEGDRLAATPDGALLVADGADRVVRWSPVDGAALVAGGREGFAGDGGPATAAAVRLDPTSGIAALPAGGFVFADTGNNRIRVVDAAGTVHTVAGNGSVRETPPRGPVSPGDGGPALAAPVTAPIGVAVAPDGGLMFSESGGRIRRVAPDGTIATIAAIAAEDIGGDLALLAQGDILAIDDDGALVRVAGSGGPPRPVLGGRDWAGRSLDHVTAVATDAAGAAFVAAGVLGRGRLWYVPGGAPARPAVALRSTTVSRGRVRVVVESSVPGPVTLRLRRGTRVLASAVSEEPTLSATAPMREGWHRVDVSVPGGLGDGVFVYVADRLSRRTARRLMGGVAQGGEDVTTFFLGDRCRAYGARRFDCELRVFNDDDEGGTESCSGIVSITLDRTGIPLKRAYRCANPRRAVFRARPRWSGSERVQPPAAPPLE